MNAKHILIVPSIPTCCKPCPPLPPKRLQQYKDDGTPIPAGAEILEDTILFAGIVEDPDGGLVKLEIELRHSHEPFTGSSTHASSWVSSGSLASIRVTKLAGDYHWQARAVNNAGEASEWVRFRESSSAEPDVVVLWAFAVIADPHVGWGYWDYGGPGYDDPDLSACQNYWVTRRLERVVETIISHNKTRLPKIRFVAVLGDITDSAEKSEFLKARQILSNLNLAGIAYVPVIGNHDILPYTVKPYITKKTHPNTRKKTELAQVAPHICSDALMDGYFHEIFWEDEESRPNRELMQELFGNSWQPPFRKPRTQCPYLQNWSFKYGNVIFACLDFAPRLPDLIYPPNIRMRCGMQPYSETWEFLNSVIKSPDNKNRTVVVFSHYPLASWGGFNTICMKTPTALKKQHRRFLCQAKQFKRDNNICIVSFGGHTHLNLDGSSSLADRVSSMAPVFEKYSNIIGFAQVGRGKVTKFSRSGVCKVGDEDCGLYVSLDAPIARAGKPIVLRANIITFGWWHEPKSVRPKNLKGCYWEFSDGESFLLCGLESQRVSKVFSSAGDYWVTVAVDLRQSVVEVLNLPLHVET